MAKEQLTMVETLKFARHDFLNKLQIVLMNIDLGNVPEARKTILNATDEMRQLSRLELLGLPKTVQWLMTFGWLYPDFENTLTCTGKRGIRKADDCEVEAYLDHIFQEVVSQLDPMVEYTVHIEVNATTNDWSIQVTIGGALLGQRPALETGASFCVEETLSHNLWTFTVSGQ